MSHREEPREVGGIYPSQQYVVAKREKRKELTPEQREAGQTWVFHTEPERPYVVGEKPPSTTVLKKPETYETWLPIQSPERPYVVGKHLPRKTDVTLIKAPPSVRAELRERQYQEQMRAYEVRRASTSDLFTKIFGVQTRLASIELGLREQVLIMEQRKLGFEMVEKKRTETGLTYYFAPIPRKGIAERLASIIVHPFGAQPAYVEKALQKIPSPLSLTPMTSRVRLFAPIGGVVASFEAPVYIVGGLLGISTPRPPPTLTTGIISKAWGSTELEQAKTYGKGYLAGTLVGDIAFSYLFGKGVEKVVATPPVQKVLAPLKTRIESWLTTKYLEKGPLAWKGWKEKAVMKITGVRPYLARGEVTLPSVVQPLSLKQLKVAQASWELTQAPRMGGVWLRNIGLAPTKTTVLPHLISRGGAISIGYLRELSLQEPLWKRGLLPFVTQKQVTRMGILPYIPKATTVIGVKGISQFVLGFGISTVLKVKHPTRYAPQLSQVSLERLQPRKRQIVTPKLWFPTLAYTREKFRSLTLAMPKRKQRERLIPVLKLPTLILQAPESVLEVPVVQVPKQVPKQIPSTAQIVTQIPSVPMPTPTIPTFPTLAIPPFRVPRGARDVSRGRRGLFGAWFKRTHPIKSPEQMLATFTGSQRKTRKPKKKKTRGVKLFGF